MVGGGGKLLTAVVGGGGKLLTAVVGGGGKLLTAVVGGWQTTYCRGGGVANYLLPW